MPDYQINMAQVLAAFATDPDKFTDYLLDSADEQTNLGGFEGPEELVKTTLKPYIARGIKGIQEKLVALTWTAESNG